MYIYITEFSFLLKLMFKSLENWYKVNLCLTKINNFFTVQYYMLFILKIFEVSTKNKVSDSNGNLIYNQTPVSRQSDPKFFFGSTNWSKNLVDY